MFFRLGDTSLYAGIYNFQYTTDEEAELYKSIMLKNWPEIFNEKEIDEKIKK
jgi:hypothetical protein